MAEPKITLGYWKIRGLAQPIRMLLRYLGVDFKDVVRAADAKRQQSTQCKEFVDSVERNTEASLRSDTLLQHYEQGPGPEFSREAWLKVKPTLGLDFPNLPYLIDDSTGVKIIQSQAILRYLARQYGANTPLYSGTAAELAEMDQFMDQLIDYRTALVRWSYGGSTNDSFWQHSLPPHLEAFSHYLSKHGKSFAVSESVTIADFIFYEVLDAVRQASREVLNEDLLSETGHYAPLAAYMARYEKDPKLASILASPDCMNRPFNNSQAVWK